VSAGTGVLATRIIKIAGPFRRLVLNDPSEKMLEQARYRLRKETAIEYSTHFAEELNKTEGRFDHILCLNSFHYYVDQPLALSHMRNLLKPDGTLWLQDWNRSGFFTVASKLIGWLSPEHINTRNLHEMKKLMSDAGFSIEQTDEWSYRWWKFLFMKGRAGE
jgi:ubiquinone/menaquinone biosynthesis C-methylase UbiE